MSAPHDGYGQYPPQQPAEQAPYLDQGYANPADAPPQPAGAQHAADHGKKKKRAYAAGAFDVAAGGNAVAGGQVQGGGQFGAPAPAYGGYPQQEAQPAPYAGQPQQPYGMAQPAAVGGYQAPEPYYPSAGAPPAQGGVAGLASGMSAMNLGPGAQQQPQQLPPQARPAPLNQLYPTDLLNQPFNVSELDLPPPPIILPPNVCRRSLPPLLSPPYRCWIIGKMFVLLY
jgi:protein transport protein SEC24